MLQAGWSWWEIVAVGGIAWTVASFLFALALGRVLRASQAHEAETSAAAPFEADETLRPSIEPPISLVDSAAVLVSVRERSMLDQLLPADLSADDQDADVSRASGTRFKPIANNDSEAPVRLRKLS